MKSHIYLLIGAYLVISSLEALGQRPKKCADYDQYCQIHSDCCSNSCLTYLYRCTRNYNGVYPYTFFGERYPVVGTLEDVIESTFSHIGSIEEIQRRRHQTPIETQYRPHGYGGYIQLYKRAIVPDKNNTIAGTIEQPQKVSRNKDINNESNIPIEETKTTDALSDCKAIGLKCFNNDECCSKRCHGFLHQCVT